MRCSSQKYQQFLQAILLSLGVILSLSPELFGQVPEFGAKVLLELEDPNRSLAIQVEAYRQYGQKHAFLLMPNSASFRVPQKSNGVPNFIWLGYSNSTLLNDSNEHCQDEEGAVLHAGVTFGYTPEQLAELERQLKEQQGEQSYLAGYVGLRPAKMPDGQSPVRLTASLIGSSQELDLETNGIVPTHPGAETIISSHLGPTNAELIRESFKAGGSLLSLTMLYEFTYMARIADGEVVFNFDRTESEWKTLSERYRKRNRLGFSFSGAITSFRGILRGVRVQTNSSVDMKTLRNVYNFLKEEKMVQFHFGGSGAEAGAQNEEELEKIKQACYDHLWKIFVNEFTSAKLPKAESPQVNAPESQMANVISDKKVRYFKSYQRSGGTARTNLRETRMISIDLPVVYKKDISYTLAVEPTGTPIKTAGEGEEVIPLLVDQKYCPECMIIIPICSPTFARRTIDVSLDAGLEYLLMEKSRNINSVHVEIRNGTWSDQITFNRNNVADLAASQQFRYSRYGRSNDSFYNYQIRTSVDFAQGSGYEDFDSGWETRDASNIVISTPNALLTKVVNPVLLVSTDLDTLRSLGISKVQIIVGDQYLGKNRQQLKTISPQSKFAKDAIEWTLNDTGSETAEFVIKYTSSGGIALYAEPQKIEWGGEIWVDGNLPPAALDDERPWELKPETKLPDPSKIVLDWLARLEDLIKR